MLDLHWVKWSLGKRIGDQCIVYKIGPRNRHWSAFAERCINNHTIRRGRSQSCSVLERCTFGEVSRMRLILFLSALSRMERLFRGDISVIYVTAHRCAGGLKKFDLRSGSTHHTYFVGFFDVPVQAPTRGQNIIMQLWFQFHVYLFVRSLMTQYFMGAIR